MADQKDFLFSENPLCLLFTEDNELNQFLISKLLSGFRDEIVFSDSGYDAINKIKERKFDIVFMDINLPRLNGLKATQLIRNEFKISKEELPIIAMTAVENSNLQTFLDAGMNGQISKPFEIPELKKVISAHLLKTPVSSTPEIKLGEFYFSKITNKEVLAKMVNLFILHKKEFFETVNQEMHQSNFQAIYNSAHKMKSTADVIGLPELKEALTTLEKYAGTSDLENVTRAFKKTQELFIMAEKALEQYVK